MGGGREMGNGNEKKIQLGTTGVEDVVKEQGKPNLSPHPSPSPCNLESHTITFLPFRGARIPWGAGGGQNAAVSVFHARWSSGVDSSSPPLSVVSLGCKSSLSGCGNMMASPDLLVARPLLR